MRQLNRRALITRLSKPDDADAIWNLYRRTGFLYPDKVAVMGDGGRKAHETLALLLQTDSPLYRVAVVEADDGRICGACTSALLTDSHA